MARNLCRTAYNTVVYEIHDYGIGIHDAASDVVADAPGIAIFTRGNDHGIKQALAFHGADGMRPGDIFLLNYPYWSSAHTLDPLVFAPIHADGQLVGFASCRIHVLDLMQKDPGHVLDSTDMYQEGLFFPSSRLYRGGESFSSSLTTTVFSQRSMRRLEASLRRATPKGHETFISRTAPHQGLAPTSGPPCVQDTLRHPQVRVAEVRCEFFARTAMDRRVGRRYGPLCR